MKNYNYDEECEDDDDEARAYIRFLAEKEERDRPLKEAILTDDILRTYHFDYFDLENLEGNYIEEYGKTNNEIDLTKSLWAINDLFATGKPLPGIDPRTGVYGPVIASIGFTIAGNDYAEMDDYESAMANYTKAIELNPRNIQALLNRGTTRCHLGEYKQAAYEDLRDAVDLNPLRLAEKNKQNRSILKQLSDESMHHLKLCLIESLHSRGIAFLKAELFDEAFDDFSEAIKYDPDNSQLYIHRALVNKEFSQYEEALADFAEALRLNPDDPLAYTHRAGVYTRMEKYHTAIEDYDKKMSLEPGSAVEYINRAFCYSKIHNESCALKDAEIAIQMDPGNREIRLCLDNIHRELKKHDKAGCAKE